MVKEDRRFKLLILAINFQHSKCATLVQANCHARPIAPRLEDIEQLLCVANIIGDDCCIISELHPRAVEQIFFWSPDGSKLTELWLVECHHQGIEAEVEQEW